MAVRGWRKIFGSALFRLIVIVIAVVVPLNLLTLILGNRVITEVERQVSLETKNALELYMSQVDDALTRMDTSMYMIAHEDADFVRLNVKEVTDREEYYRQLQSVVNLGLTMSEELEDNSLVDGVFAYFYRKDYFVIPQDCVSQEANAVRRWVAQEITAQYEGGYGVWRNVEIDGEPYLIRLAFYRNACYGAWVNLRELSGALGFSENGVQAFAAETGEVFYSNVEGLAQIDLDAKDHWYSSSDYTAVWSKSTRTDLYFAQLLTKSELTDSLPAALRALQILSIVAVISIPIILVAMQYWIGRPVNKLMTAMERIEQGDVEYRIEETQKGTEFDRINRMFNRSMDEVSELKTNIYEQKLKTERIQLAFLSQQIQPHFILNTLNILYSYEQEEHELRQKMILCLSKYFRYVVNANANYVTLGQELGHIRNYFEIQQARFIHNFRAVVVCDEELEDCLIPPLLVQNFTENAIKHSLIPGQIVSIVVEAEKAGEDKIHICVYDTGAGIPERVLERILEFQRTCQFCADLGVGIQNSIDRLEILYGDQASLDISRIDPQGTRIDIMIPIKRKDAFEDECDFN